MNIIHGQKKVRTLVPGLCTHHLSHHGIWPCPKSLPLTAQKEMSMAGVITRVKS